MFLPRLVGADATPRKPDGKVSSEPVDHIVPASGLDGMYRVPRPLGKLAREEAADQRYVNRHFCRGPGATGHVRSSKRLKPLTVVTCSASLNLCLSQVLKEAKESLAACLCEF
jgi:hypothetical protein